MTGRKFSFGTLFGRPSRPNPTNLEIVLKRPSMNMMHRLRELIKRPINALKRHRNGRA